MASVDAMLVNLTLQGDQEAFARLMQRHRPGLLNLALSHAGNLSEAEDIVQEAFIQAYQHLATLKNREKFAGWIYRITLNLCYALQRKRSLALRSLDASDVAGISDESISPDDLIEGRELSESIVKAVATLPEKNQSVFLLYLEGWSYRNIATSSGLSTSTVLGRIQRSKRHLRNKILKDVGFAASPGPLHIEREYLREEIFKMSEAIVRPKALRRRIYGLGDRYRVQLDKPALPIESAQMYLFRVILSGRSIYPDVFLENGARLYCSPNRFVKYATPECDDLKAAICHQKAGEHLLERLSLSSLQRMKNDGHAVEHFWLYQGLPQERGKVVSSQENYLIDAKVTKEQLNTQLVPFLVTRQIFSGSGSIEKKVKYDEESIYFISARARHLYAVFTESNIAACGMIGEVKAWADEKRYQRLCLTLNDSNRSESAIYLKIGTTAMILQMIEDGFIEQRAKHSPKASPLPADPIQACKIIAADPSCRHTVALQNGKSVTAIDIQRQYLSLARRYFDSIGRDSEIDDLLQRWESVLNRLEEDPMQLDREVDWVIKKRLIDEAQNRNSCALNDSRILEIESNYHRLDQESEYAKLVGDGKVERVVIDEEIDSAMNNPPETTRAKVRGKFVKLANERKILCGVNWSYIQLYEPYQKLFLSADPLKTEFEEANRQLHPTFPSEK